MSNVMRITGAVAAAMLAVAPRAFGQASTQTAADSGYIREAMSGNFLEVALGRVADSRASDQSVKDFANQMIKDHNSMNEEWAKVAKNNRVPVPLGLDAAGKQSVDQLQKLSGSEFDQAYMTQMIRGHEQVLAAFQRIAQSASASDVRELANNDVPTIREHLTLAQQVGNRIGIATTAGRVGGETGPISSGDTGRRPTVLERNRVEGVNRNDRNRVTAIAFMDNVLQNHIMQTRMAELAQSRARNKDVRQYAERIEQHMTDWGRRWENVARRSGRETPDHLGHLHRQNFERVEKASKKNFDRTYLEVTVDHLESLVPYFEKEGHQVQSADVRRLVNDELPEIRDLLQRGRRLENQTKR